MRSLLVIALFLLSTALSISFKLLSEYFAFGSVSLDGRFQTFNIVNGLRGGCTPFVDCVPYIGLQISYLLTAVSFATGSTPFGVSAAAHAISWLLAAGSVLLLLRLSGWRWSWACIATLFALLVLRLGAVATLDPGNSLRSVRSAAPAIAAMVLWLLCHRRSSQEPIAPGAVKAATFGAVGGFFFLWSNDFGVATTVALLLVWTTVIEDWRRPVAAAGRSLLCALTAVASILALLAWSTSMAAWKNTSARIAENQFWYFAPFGDSARFRTPADLAALNVPAMAIIAFLMIAALVLTIRRFRLKDRSFANAMLLTIVLATFGGGAIYILFGQIDSAIWEMAARVVPVVLGCQALFWLSSRPADTRIGSLAKRLQGGLLADPRLQLGIAIVLMAISAVKDARPAYRAYRLYEQNRVLAGDAALAQARSVLGANPDADAEATACFRRLRDRFDAAGVPGNRRVWSQYTSALDLAAGAREPTSVPTWIFLFGPEAKRDLLRAVRTDPPALVLTIANDYSPWANWLSRADWPLYREILRYYAPALRTRQHIIWMRRESPLPVQPGQQCRAEQLSPDQVRLHVSPLPGSGSGADQPQWVQIDQQLVARVAHGGVPVLGDRLQLNGRVPVSDPLGPIHDLFRKDPAELRLFGLDPAEKVTTVPVVTRPGEGTHVDLQVFPADRGTATAYGRCTATPIAPLELTRERSPPMLQSCSQLDAVATQSMRRLQISLPGSQRAGVRLTPSDPAYRRPSS